MHPIIRKIIGAAPCPKCFAGVGKSCSEESPTPHFTVHVERAVWAEEVLAQDAREYLKEQKEQAPNIDKLWAELQRKKPERRFNLE